ncbi:MAG: rhomboid family intramembrane serine protease [Opitutales bacterium]
MGVGDRTYMRGPRPAAEPRPLAQWAVGALVLFFIVGLVGDSARSDLLGWAELRTPGARPWQWFTYAFVHDGFWHLLGNGLLLWWTGAIVERERGTRVFVGVLTAGTAVGALAWWATGLGGSGRGVLIGASAATHATILVALLGRLEDRITVLLFFFLPVNMKVRWVVALTAAFAVAGWIFSELPMRNDWRAWRPAWESSVAHSAHLGGLLVGLLAWRRGRQTETAPGYAQREMPDGRTAYSDHPEFAHAGEEEAPEGLSRARARAELDALLDKISARGFGSLTPEEKRRLEELSARLR